MVVEKVVQTVLLTTVVTGLAVLGAYVYQRLKKQRIPTKWTRVGTVKKLYLYPLKSGNRIELDEAECTPSGLKQTVKDDAILQLRDRGLVVYGAKDNEFRTARTYPKMVKIDVSVHDEEHLAIDAPTMRTLYVKIPNKNENQEAHVKCWRNERICGVDCGDEAATWFSRYIIERDSGLRLAYNDGHQRRDISKTHEKLLNYYKNLNSDATGLFSDLSSVLLINQTSVTDMNRRIANSTATCENFRPNVIVDGPNLQPYDEDKWDWIRIGADVIFRNVKECTRCTMTTINPNTAVRDPGREPLKTLESYRMSNGPEKTPVMGINLGVQSTGLLKIGDPVLVAIKDE